MLDHYLQPQISRALGPAAVRLAKGGITADTVTVVGFLIGIAAVPLLASQNYILALTCILTNRLCDGLDGPVARLSGPTDRGAFMDIAFDFFFYASVPFGFALADPKANAVAAVGLLLAFVGTSTSFLAFAAVAHRRGLSSRSFPNKGIYYLGGLTEGTETIAVFILMCLWPTAFPYLAGMFGLLCMVTTVTRWWWGWRTFSDIRT